MLKLFTITKIGNLVYTHLRINVIHIKYESIKGVIYFYYKQTNTPISMYKSTFNDSINASIHIKMWSKAVAPCNYWHQTSPT